MWLEIDTRKRELKACGAEANLEAGQEFSCLYSVQP